MKDGERLNLLKEVAGTKVYEQRREESLKIMEDTGEACPLALAALPLKHVPPTEAKRAKIVDLLEKIEERLAELEEEKKELKDFTELDRDRRCLEYALYARDLADVDQTLESVRAGIGGFELGEGYAG